MRAVTWKAVILAVGWSASSRRRHYGEDAEIALPDSAASFPGTRAVLFLNPRRKWQNNVAVLDTEKWHWRHPTIDGSNPAPRSYHSATVVGTMMVVFGGNNQHESFDRVHVLDTSESCASSNPSVPP